MKEKYDVVIIGAGVGGLTCSCYLAKAGLKVLIVEQHDKPGGYCTSFKRNGFRFDVGVHYLGGLKKSFLRDVLEELNLRDRMNLNQFDPTDKIIMPENVTYIRTNLYDTIEEFKKSFPKEETNIIKFFNFITQDNFYSIYKKCKTISFKEILDEFFEDFRIKSTLEALLSNIGLSAQKFSALSAIVLYRDYILDGGYYPEKGMQGFPDALADTFKNYNGELIVKKKVTNILVKNKRVYGVVLDDGEKIKTNFVVSNCDATQTFKELLKDCPSKESTLVEKLIVSSSIFSMYIGIKKDLRLLTKDTCNIWSFDSYNIDESISDLKKNISKPNLPFIMISFPSSHSTNSVDTQKNTIQFFQIANFESEDFWNKYKSIISDKLIEKAKKIIPNFDKYVEVKVIATPLTFFKYTLNKNGAISGWASNINQIRSSLFPQKTSIEGLFIAGHWCTIGSGQGGVPKVVFSGRKAANLILNRVNKE